MDAARGPPASLGATPSARHDTLSSLRRTSPVTLAHGRRYQQLWLAAILAVTSPAEDSPSGLWRTIGNRVGC